jgi:hypothetical protein
VVDVFGLVRKGPTIDTNDVHVGAPMELLGEQAA